MDLFEPTRLSNQYSKELVDNIIPFWEKNSIDDQYGGFITCLDRKGNWYDTDKFVWLQGRQVWTFSMLYQEFHNNSEWFEYASKGAEFLLKNGKDENGDYFFSLTRDGHPLIAPYNIFSDCFACMAFSRYGFISGDEIYLNEAKRIFDRILYRESNPKGRYEKRIGNRPIQNFTLPMILSNLVMELGELVSNSRREEIIEGCVHKVMDIFRDEETSLIFENKSPSGELVDSFEGRLINPGHGLEAMWFILDIANQYSDVHLANRAIKSIENILEYAWDKEHGGIFYFMDIKGHPTQQLEWDQKLWWVHLEALVALSKAISFRHSENLVKWFNIIHEYTWSHFRDGEFGEWYGYLNREGNVLLPLKGGKWKGFFHVPRALHQISGTFSKMDNA